MARREACRVPVRGPQPRAPGRCTPITSPRSSSGSHPRPHDRARAASGRRRRLRHPRGATARRRPSPRCGRMARASPLEHVADGLWQGFAPAPGPGVRARDDLRRRGRDWVADDPYRFVPSVGEVDLYLWGEGRHEQLWHVLGAHYRPHEDVAARLRGLGAARAGRCASSATSTRGTARSTRCAASTTTASGSCSSRGSRPAPPTSSSCSPHAGEWVKRADPMARYTEVPPATASVVGDSVYAWSDAEWLDAPRQPRPAQLAAERVRAAPRLLAARARLPRARRPADRVRDASSASRTSSSCRSPSTRSAARGATR